MTDGIALELDFKLECNAHLAARDPKLTEQPASTEDKLPKFADKLGSVTIIVTNLSSIEDMANIEHELLELTSISPNTTSAATPADQTTAALVQTTAAAEGHSTTIQPIQNLSLPIMGQSTASNSQYSEAFQIRYACRLVLGDILNASLN